MLIELSVYESNESTNPVTVVGNVRRPRQVRSKCYSQIFITGNTVQMGSIQFQRWWRQGVHSLS